MVFSFHHHQNLVVRPDFFLGKAIFDRAILGCVTLGSTMKYSILFFTLFFANITLAEPLSAIVTFASTVVTAEGITKQTQFQDLLVRDKNSIWTQRIIAGAAPQPAEGHRHSQQQDHHHNQQQEHHHNLNFSLAGRWIELDNSNQTRFRLVHAEDKTIIEPRINEYGTLGFDGVWETAYYQVNRAALKTMKVLNNKAPKYAVWYEKQDEQAFIRVLWDGKNEIPLAIETGNRDGKTINKITFTQVTPPATLPWQALSDYHTIAYEDLLD